MVSKIGKISCGQLSKIKGGKWDWIFQKPKERNMAK